MAASRADIAIWLKEGKKLGATHTMIVCDTFDHEDYPVHVMKCEDAREKFNSYNGKDMQTVMEVYSHSLDHVVQMDEHRAFHFEYNEDVSKKIKERMQRSLRKTMKELSSKDDKKQPSEEDDPVI